HHQFRLLRAIKNRFGATNELGVFQMQNSGLSEVQNPSEFFLEDRNLEAIGSSIFAAMEGTRPLLCEIQALTASSPTAMPRRTALGFDHNRVHMILAVLDKFLKIDSSHADVFINVVGGLRVTEPAADLAAAAAILSSASGSSLSGATCFFGEIGLTGEVRAANFAIERVKEAVKLGFQRIVLPESNRKHMSDEWKNQPVTFIFIKEVRDLMRLVSGSQKKPHKSLQVPKTSLDL
ncbi:MAG: DNA repair protein RadA, partial [Bdellovibrionales bacterium]|nr:DNA repair protein RadA [Bdellovibrionales bacterium]